MLTMIAVPCLYRLAFGIDENSTEPLKPKDHENA